jgi:hypothetical protein
MLHVYHAGFSQRSKKIANLLFGLRSLALFAGNTEYYE